MSWCSDRVCRFVVMVFGYASACIVDVDDDDPAYPTAASLCAAYADCGCPGHPRANIERDECEREQIRALGRPTLDGLREAYPEMEFAFDPTCVEALETWADGLQCDGQSSLAEDCATYRCVGNMIYGPQREGEACEISSQCARGLACGRSSDGADVCIDYCARTPSSAGGPCDVYGVGCEPGLSCLAGFCVTPGELGDVCDSDSCAEGLYCADGCRPILAAGSACDSALACESHQCVDGLCAARGQVGDPCGLDQVPCERGLSCFDGECSEEPILCAG